MLILSSTILYALTSFLPLTAGIATPELAETPTSKYNLNSHCPPRTATIEEQRAAFANFTNLIYTPGGNVTEAYLTYVAEDYIQHNPNTLSGRQNSIDAVQAVIDAGATFEVINTAFEDDWGYAFLRVNFAGAAQPTAVVDILRMNGSCIVEHWDVMQERPANATNPIAM
ncbi:hypothetical protein DBV05_g10164 [Lasiodiplodia theobromae]|uniref:SnoaL-like domain-containing protein n=1 Tax=Lasiodiplodia theobromae TaxID=45133 RepID=A0A5N5D0M7_9PEZI|nr:hypothetical protein DBV05_g10164 [Lasiodiplodia theobromae]